jgi:L,D-transpeptidase catalytic domain
VKLLGRILMLVTVGSLAAGCVRMSDDAAAWVYHDVPIGTPVIVK